MAAQLILEVNFTILNFTTYTKMDLSITKTLKTKSDIINLNWFLQEQVHIVELLILKEFIK